MPLPLNLLNPENYRPYPVRAATDHSPVILHPPFKHPTGEISPGEEYGYHRVDVTPCPVTEILGLSEAAYELLPFLKTWAGCDLVNTVLFRQFQVERLFDDSNFTLRHTIFSSSFLFNT